MITVKTLLSEGYSIRQQMADEARDAHDDHIDSMFPKSDILSTQSISHSLSVSHHGHSSIVRDKDGNLHHVISVSKPDGKSEHEVHPIKMHIPILD